MSAAPAYQQARFVRRTRLQQNEYNKNFRMIDAETLLAVTSIEADVVTPLMSKIYLRLLQAPDYCCRGERELHFEGEVREGKRTKAWEQLCRHLRVSSETAQKALAWMHEQGIIGYSAFKNGIGIFIFLNRAASSIGVRSAPCKENILQFPPVSAGKRPASLSDTPSNDPFGDSENSDTDLNPHAPKNGANNTEVEKKLSNHESPSTSPLQLGTAPSSGELDAATVGVPSGMISVDEIVMRLQSVLEPALKTVAVQAAQREHERTREWLDKHGIPKATRVAQREAYNVLRSHGVIAAAADIHRRADLQVGGASGSYTPQEAHPLSEQEIIETGETCVALLEAQGKSIEVTLSEISSEAGGWLLPEDVPRVREAAQALLPKRSEGR
ncbi:MAG: hypothetical protein H0W76_12890 [Pyrinomonadaceae bacterium]|nr:hypothetical protein [Pyrinomonadaceae bacterium]